jgi:4-amino-4-deoxy-L-arabinose transferase-like glycosyltransferase
MKRKYLLLFLVIFILGIYLRCLNYAKIPRHGATFDEFAWTWLGINLIQKGVPISWSSQPQYNNREHLIYQGAAFWIVKPYLEHPPLFGIVAGSFALLNGATDMYHVTLEKIRPLAIILGAFSILLVFMLTAELYGEKTALISSAIYATAPVVVIGSRIVQNENFLIPCWLLSIYLIAKYLKTGKKKFRNIAAIIAGLLSLAKVPWLVVGLSLSMILSYKKKWKDAFLVSGITIVIFSLFILYGIYFDKELFLNLWKLQLARYDISFGGFLSIFTSPLLIDRYYLGGWTLFGWLSIFLLCRDLKKNYMIIIPFVAYLVTYIFAIPNEPAHGWYRYPFFPFLLISSAIVLWDEMKKVSFISLFFIFFVGLALLSNTWQIDFGFSFVAYRVFILAGVLSIILSLWNIMKCKSPTILWIVFFILLNIWSVFSYIE